jgi:hypothetical protein
MIFSLTFCTSSTTIGVCSQGRNHDIYSLTDGVSRCCIVRGEANHVYESLHHHCFSNVRKGSEEVRDAQESIWLSNTVLLKDAPEETRTSMWSHTKQSVHVSCSADVPDKPNKLFFVIDEVVVRMLNDSAAQLYDLNLQMLVQYDAI